jgi:hypothetical protein
MKTNRGRRPVRYYLVASFLLLGTYAFADTQSMNCNDKPPATHAQLAQGDQNTPTHLQLSRKIAVGASISLNVCDADLTIKGGNGDQLQVTVDLDNPAAKLNAGDYLQVLEVTPQGARLRLDLPKRVRAKVLIVMPAAMDDLAVNLVRGDLILEADKIAGERNINVVRGHMDFLGNPDSYDVLHVNVVMGSMHDHRQGGEDHHFMTSQSYGGSGKGTVDINVVMGSVDLKAWD